MPGKRRWTSGHVRSIGVRVLDLLPIGTAVMVNSARCVTQSLVWEDPRDGLRKVVVSGQPVNPLLLEAVTVMVEDV